MPMRRDARRRDARHGGMLSAEGCSEEGCLEEGCSEEGCRRGAWRDVRPFLPHCHGNRRRQRAAAGAARGAGDTARPMSRSAAGGLRGRPDTPEDGQVGGSCHPEPPHSRAWGSGYPEPCKWGGCGELTPAPACPSRGVHPPGILPCLPGNVPAAPSSHCPLPTLPLPTAPIPAQCRWSERGGCKSPQQQQLRSACW